MKTAIIQYARLSSERTHQKILTTFGDKTLLQIGLDKMCFLKDIYDISLVIACSSSDTLIIDEAKSRSIDIIPLSVQQGRSEIFSEYTAPTTSYLIDHDIDRIWLSNIICRPLLTIDTCRHILDACITSSVPLITVSLKRGSIWNKQFNLLHNYRIANTKTNDPYYEFAHLGYCFSRSDLSFDYESQLVLSCNPLPLDLSWKDKIDIDTEDDLAHLRMIERVIHPETCYTGG